MQIRLDADILEWLKHTGYEYQTRANDILRLAMLLQLQARYVLHLSLKQFSGFSHYRLCMSS
ncbi:MAG: BrnA antitoxin family protein [Treponema sp.]|nr:BrnA antitoxin family protein [Treponema sp.]